MQRLFLFAFILLIKVSVAQSKLEADLEDDHHDGDWEVGAAAGVLPLMDENELGLSFHFHILNRIHKIKGLSVGLGFENVFDEHKHFNTGIVLNYNIVKGLFVSFSPGMVFIKESNLWEKEFSTHYEISYEFEFKSIHIGPLLEYSLSKSHQHYMIGVHTGLSF